MSKFKKTEKATSVFLSVTTAVWLSGAAALVPVAAQADTVDDLQAQIQALLAQIATLQSQLSALQGGGGSTTACGYTFSTDLMMGDMGTDVMNLQKVFNSDSATQVAASGVGSAGNETEYFGSLTKAAAVKFQEKYAADVLTPLGLSAGTGYVGPSSRAKLNELFGVCPTTSPSPTTSPTPTPQGTGLTVALAANQPASSLFPGTATSQAARVPFTIVNFTASADGDVTVSGLTIERTGLGTDSNFAGVVLLDEDGNQIGLAKTLNSNHQAILSEDFVVKAGQTRTLTIAGNSADNTARAGQVVYLSLVGVDTSATVNGSLPLTGTSHTVSGTLSIGTVTMARGPLDPVNAANKKVGTEGYIFTSVKVTAGSQEKVRVKSIRWNQSGSAGEADLANIVTIVDGTEYATMVSADGKYYTATFGEGIVIDKGFSKEIYIKGDIVSGSGRTIDFDIYKNTDLYVTGETYNYGISAPTNGSAGVFGATTPWYNAAAVTVTAGSMNVTKAVSVEAQNIAVNLADQVLGGWEVEVKGEEISIAQMVFTALITQSGGTAVGTDIDSVTLVDGSGSIVAGPVDATGAGTTATITFTDTVTFPVGTDTYTLKGKLTTNFGNNDTIAASTTPSTDWTTVTGLTTGNTITPAPTSAVTANTMTVKTTSLAVSVSAAPVAQNVVAGVSGFTFANYIFDASQSGEDLKLTNIPLAYHVVAGAATDLTNCQLWDGATAVNTGSNVINPSAISSSTNFVFDGTGLQLPKGTTKSLALKCDISGNSSTGNAYSWGLDTAQAATYSAATGLTSGQTVSETFAESMGQTMTVANGTLTVTLDSSSPSYTVSPSGSTGVTLSALRVSAVNEDITLQRIALQLSGTASNSPIDLAGGKVMLYDGATLVGEATFVDDNATSTLSQALVIPKDSHKVLTVKADLAAIGISQAGTQGALVKVDYDNDDPTGTRGIGASSGTTRDRTSSADTASAGVRTFRSVPTFARFALPSTELPRGTNTGVKLARFSVTADVNGDVGVYKFSFEVGSSTVATTSAFGLYAFSNSGFSSVVNLSGGTGGLLNAGNGHNANCTTDQSTLENAIYMNPATCGVGTTTLQIPAGVTRYFELRGTVAGAAGGDSIGDSITIKLYGDAAYPSLAAATLVDLAATVDADTHNDFIWTPNATTTSLITHQDFTNGFGVDGLSADNMDSWTLSESTL